MGFLPSRIASQSANGGSPARSMYATTPAAQASTLKSYGRRRAISGDKYAYVPHRSVKTPSRSLMRAASPKSLSFARRLPSGSRMYRKLAGFTSRCTTPCAWHAASARRTARIVVAAAASVNGFQDSIDRDRLYDSDAATTDAAASSANEPPSSLSLLVPVSKSPPSQRSMSKCTPASSSNASCSVTMSRDAPSAKCRLTSSRTLRSQTAIASPAGAAPSRLCGPAFGIVLSAKRFPSDRRVHDRTTPIAPRPMGSPSTSASSASRRRPSVNGSADSGVDALDEGGVARGTGRERDGPRVEKSRNVSGLRRPAATPAMAGVSVDAVGTRFRVRAILGETRYRRTRGGHEVVRPRARRWRRAGVRPMIACVILYVIFFLAFSAPKKHSRDPLPPPPPPHPACAGIRRDVRRLGLRRHPPHVRAAGG